jgi:hypothetical protein
MTPTPVVENPARPVSLFTIIFLFVLFAAFLFFVRRAYSPTTIAAQNSAAEQLPKDLAWKADATTRRATLKQTIEEQAKRATSYGWADQKAGVVSLPIQRAMELVVQEQGAKQQVRQIRDLPANPPVRR